MREPTSRRLIQSRGLCRIAACLALLFGLAAQAEAQCVAVAFTQSVQPTLTLYRNLPFNEILPLASGEGCDEALYSLYHGDPDQRTLPPGMAFDKDTRELSGYLSETGR